MRRLRSTALAMTLAVAGFALAMPAFAQESDFETRVPPEVLDVVREALTRAAADGLPVAALQAKVLEGVAKQVPPERIGRVVSDLAVEFRSVREAMTAQMPGVALSHPELVAAAMASRHGVAPDVLASVWESRGDAATMEVPVTVLGELVRRGVPVPDAANVMSHVVRSRVPMHVAAQIPGKLDGARGAGAPPGAALGQALKLLNIPDPPGRGRGRGRGPGG